MSRKLDYWEKNKFMPYNAELVALEAKRMKSWQQAIIVKYGSMENYRAIKAERAKIQPREGGKWVKSRATTE